MKKIIYTGAAILIVGLATFTSCDKIKDLAKVNFTMENGGGEFDILPLTAAVDINMGMDDVSINLDSIISAQNSKVSSKNIKEVHIKSCELNLTNGDADNNFSALESCQVDIKSNVKPEYVKMAGVTNNPDIAANTLNLPVESSLELKDYFVNANTFSYRLSGKTRKATTKALHCTMLIKYTITAGL